MVAIALTAVMLIVMFFANTQEKDDDEDEDGDVDNNGWAHAQEKATLCQRMSSEAANITPSHDQPSRQNRKTNFQE